ncbi:F-box/FBD/LRR-repeat protein At5g56420-like [Silene latifolia]|uniref:F-box/FBD/LRR-repeat protein At5g56420-like n=1 Tax=Silene latifolia TaxID=37657 RepID=UPI003D77F25C
MPTLDAVRTMLHRRFQNLWAMVPSLSFDFEDYSDEMIWIDGKPPNNDVAFSSFACFVRNVLMLYRRSTIDNFCLTISNLGEKANDAKIIGDVRMWLRYAIEKEVKDLHFNYCGVSFDLPPCVFTSQSLGTLMLSGCTIKHYEHQSHIHMGMLTKLSLFCVMGSTKTFNQLISGCTSLKELIMSFAADPGSEILNINAPSLSKLYLRHLNYPCTLNCPSLKMLDIGAYERSPYFQLSVVGVLSLHKVNLEYLPTRCFSGEVQPFFKLVQNAEVFTLSCKAFEEISSVEKIEFPQNRWRRIVLNLEWTGERCLEVIFELMKKSVNLEELKIYAGESSGDSQLLCSELTACVLPLLKTVTIHGNHGYKKWCEGQLQEIGNYLWEE